MGIALPSSKQTLLKIVTNACQEMGLTAPASLFGNTDPQAIQLLALAQREGREFYRKPGKNGFWQILRAEADITTIGGGAANGNATAGSPIISGIVMGDGGTTSEFTLGWTPVAFNVIPVNATIITINSPTEITMSLNALQPTDSQDLTNFSFYAGQASYALPNDYDSMITQTMWDRSFRWQLLGPLEAQEWQVLKSGISPTGPRRRYRIFNNLLWIDPVPSATQYVAFEYLSNAWAQTTGGASGTANAVFTADTDNYLLDDDVLTLGIKWRWKQAKGLDYSKEEYDYMTLADATLARDGGMRNVPLNASASGIRLLNEQNVPDTGYGS